MTTHMDKRHCKSWVRQHFSELNKGAKCNHCGKYYVAANAYSLKVHLNRVHEIYNDEDYFKWKNDTNGVIWQHFSKQDGYAARCNFEDCKVLVQYAYIITHLTAHLERYHEHIVKTKREEIEHTWLSRHFKFMGCYASCKISNCSYNINIFREINYLISHMDKCHNIHEERTNDNDNNADVMIQQSIDETNYAGSGSHHDNTPKQSLRNQEGQQRRQRGSESHNKIWRPYL